VCYNRADNKLFGMSLIKTTVPNEATLQKRTKEAFAAGMTDFLARTTERRVTVMRNRRYAITSVVIFIFSIFALALANSYLEGAKLNLVTMYLLGLVVVTLIFNHRWYCNDKILSQELNLALVPIVTATFSRLVLYSHDNSHRVAAKKALLESGILPEAEAVFAADDVYTFFEPFDIQIRKIQFKRKVSKFQFFKNSSQSGVLVEATLNKVFSGQTFIEASKPKLTTPKDCFWCGLEPVLLPVPLSLSQSEATIEAASTNLIESEAILTPDFLSALVRFGSENKDAVRVVIKENKVFIFFLDSSSQHDSAATSTNTKELISYSLVALRPMWRILALLEEVE
jgi:hypothetical protein